MEKKTVSWSVTVNCIATVENTENGPEIVQVVARDIYGNSVSLNLGDVDCHAEERAMAENEIFEYGPADLLK